MKKILFLIAIIITLALNAGAQSDSFFKNNVNSDYRGDVASAPSNLNAPSGPLGTIKDGDVLPLGSGLLILTVLGGAYVIGKKK